MIHSDILNSLSNNEKFMLLACINHYSGKEYEYEQLSFIRKPILKRVLEKYYNIINKEFKPDYKKMVEKLNKLFKSL